MKFLDKLHMHYYIDILYISENTQKVKKMK